MMAMRSARRIASSKSWVMKTMVLCSARLQPQELVLHLAADQRVERRERLVEEPDLRARPRASGRCRPAAAGRRRARAAGSSSRPLSPTSSIISRARASRSARGDALDLEREGDVAEHREMRQQREVLEHHAHAVPADLDQLAVGDAAEVAAVEADLAGASARPAARGSGPASTCPSRTAP